mgnify:CR=1 FL=1
MKEEREYLFYLREIEDATNQIFIYSQHLALAAFKKNRLVVDAVIRTFEIINEACKNIPEIIKDKYPQVPWSKIYRLLNIVSHDYFGIDNDVIWKIVTDYLPENYQNILSIIEMKSKNESQ